MNYPRRLLSNTQNFERLRRDGDLYVDKTQYIEKLQALGKVFFLSRPHRLGKSLFLSTLGAYFEGKKDLFEGLYIAAHEEEIARSYNRTPWEASPVLYFSLNATYYGAPEALTSSLTRQLREWETVYGVTGEALAPDRRFVYLIEELYRKEGKQVVILVDEYDKPLLNTMDNEALNEANCSLLKAFYEVMTQCDQYIRFAFLTGITKFSKTTLFSGVKNLIDITLLDDYDAICGFTEEEVTANLSPEIEELAMAEKSTVKKMCETLKKLYGGFCFSRKGMRVYNPFSLFNALSGKACYYYWFETGTPSYLVNFLKRTGTPLPNLEEDIKIDGEVLEDFRYNDPAYVIHYLFYSGYLTIKKYLDKEHQFVLGFPNEEVRSGFLGGLLHYIRPDISPMGLPIDFRINF